MWPIQRPVRTPWSIKYLTCAVMLVSGHCTAHRGENITLSNNSEFAQVGCKNLISVHYCITYVCTV